MTPYASPAQRALRRAAPDRVSAACADPRTPVPDSARSPAPPGLSSRRFRRRVAQREQGGAQRPCAETTASGAAQENDRDAATWAPRGPRGWSGGRAALCRRRFPPRTHAKSAPPPPAAPAERTSGDRGRTGAGRRGLRAAQGVSSRARLVGGRGAASCCRQRRPPGSSSRHAWPGAAKRQRRADGGALVRFERWWLPAARAPADPEALRTAQAQRRGPARRVPVLGCFATARTRVIPARRPPPRRAAAAAGRGLPSSS